MIVLPGVLGCRPLRRTIQVRLGTNTLRLPGGTPIFVVSRQQFIKYPGLMQTAEERRLNRMWQYGARPPAGRGYGPEGGEIEGNGADDALLADQAVTNHWSFCKSRVIIAC
jgi:hypothetical protein